MTCSSIVSNTQLTWISGGFSGQNATALLIPQYNEGRKRNFMARLDYYRQLAEQNRGRVDVILIDDGSTDNSLETMTDYVRQWSDAFNLAAIFPNGNKVGALSHVSLAIPHEFIILSDFDTDLDGLSELLEKNDIWRNDTQCMGYFFRMLPFEGSGKIFRYQQLEYSMARSRYKFHEKENTVPVMPGAGCCIKREMLNAVYLRHSGLRNGEDREATAIGQQMGYGVSYMDKVLALTLPPLTYRALVKQRIRWNLGYLETFYLQKDFYFREMRRFSAMGVRTFIDLFSVLLILLIPLAPLFIGFNAWLYLYLGAGFYLSCIALCIGMLRIAPREYAEIKRDFIPIVLLFPVIKLGIDYVAWMAAVIKFFQKNYVQYKIKSA